MTKTVYSVHLIIGVDTLYLVKFDTQVRRCINYLHSRSDGGRYIMHNGVGVVGACVVDRDGDERTVNDIDRGPFMELDAQARHQRKARGLPNH